MVRNAIEQRNEADMPTAKAALCEFAISLLSEFFQYFAPGLSPVMALRMLSSRLISSFNSLTKAESSMAMSFSLFSRHPRMKSTQPEPSRGRRRPLSQLVKELVFRL